MNSNRIESRYPEITISFPDLKMNESVSVFFSSSTNSSLYPMPSPVV